MSSYLGQTICCCVALVMWLDATPALSVDIKVPLSHRRLGDKEFSIFECRVICNAVTSEWSSITLPKVKTEKPLLFERTIAGRSHIFLNDFDSPDALYYNRIFYDQNHNRDFGDDTPSTAVLTQKPSGYVMTCAPVELDLDVFGQKTWRFFMHGGGYPLKHERAGKYKSYTTLQFRDAMSGRFDLDGKTYQIDFFDQTCDGMLDIGRTQVPGSRSTFDMMRLVQVGGTEEGYPDCRPFEVSRILALRGHTFIVSPDPQGKYIRLEEIGEKASGTLEFPDDTIYAVLKNFSTNAAVVIYPKGPVRLPEGSYELNSCYLCRMSKESKNQWIVKNRNQNTKRIVIAAAKPAAVLIEEPFKLSCELRSYSNDKVGPCISMCSKNGEAISTDIVVQRWPKAPLPDYRLTGSDGGEVKVGKLGYG